MQTLTREDKFRFIEGFRIIHPQFQKAMNFIEEVHHESTYSSDPLSVLIYGDSGAGKTTIYETYIAKFNKVESQTVNGMKTSTRVILYASVPSPASHINLTERLLTELGDQYPNRGTSSQKYNRLVNLISLNRVELILLDEFQHFVDRDKEKVIYKISDWFKSLINQTKVPFVLFGLEDSSLVLDYNPQLSRRFPIRLNLKPFGYHSKSEVETFRRLMHEIDLQLAEIFVSPAMLADELMCDRMYYATRGSIDSIMKLIRKAAKYAIDREAECIELADFARAYELYTHVSMGKTVNPFLIEDFSLSKFPLT
ncbi:TniB family NTP-binding protein [Paenibacillus chondroitinus]|uniref:TniB family NTP-binding protein n=1 Tax=Paenibacillus chondroitinus TaxID=59842 RepID=A0ABU6DHG2_9BACL|nr:MULTISPECIES: TniB family NTP-binding protein [Paenibacillus]MCY9658492.1 TniB family NTP-binding protein [Paenibacillus anseongense]MEB4797204.1 TniB family NTP-binding protein [Paenibacillus chondroitinus]